MHDRAALQPVTLDWRNKLARCVWGLVYILLYRPSPRLFHGWRRLLLRGFGATIAAGAHPYPRARIWAPWNLQMDRDAGLADDVDCYNVALVRIGTGATVSQYSYLCTAGHDPDRAGGTMPLIAAPIDIGAGAWVAADAYIGPGVCIGDGAVVGARSTVLRSVPARAIVAGNPARLIRMRAE